MAHYIDADRLIAEFQKRFKKCKKVSEDDRNALDTRDWYRGKYAAYSEALSFITSLQQEQPEADLEKELIEWHKRHFKKTGTYEKYSGFYLENSSQLDLARHFYELGLNTRKEE